ncbi:hypothetical protein GCM10022236_43040 [Microlunatus ginsengisoli]|uniref:alpha-amylase n=2 Tax=Microlunatus ginsengisoli TaxID=363863 RepID=A0ABP7AMN0_9ACTN
MVAALALLLSFLVPSAVAISPPDPPTVSKVGDSATAVKVSWSGVTGAKGYRIQYSTSASFGSPKFLPASTKSDPLTDTSAVVSGLSTGKQYYFRVAVVDPDSLKVLSQTYSKPVSATVSYPFRAPGDSTPSLITKRSAKLSWAAVPNATEYGVRLATSPSAKPKFYRTATNSISLSGLKANTLYYVKTYVGNTSKRISDYSPENQFVTSGYSNAAPSGLKVVSQGPGDVKLAWTALNPLPAGTKYVVSIATEFIYPVPGREPSVPLARFKGVRTRGPYTTNSATITGLVANTTYYAQVYLIGRQNQRITSSSDFVTAKTIVARGTISGKTTGVTGDDLTASAYLGNELVEQVTVGSDNAYSMAVRPGGYKVLITYTGSGNYASAWARSGKDGGRIPAEASVVNVARDKATTAPTVKLHTGAVVSGIVRDRSGRAVRDVDITALTAMTSAREVEVVGTSAPNGKYILRGLPDGRHWLRYAYSGDGFKTRSVEIVVTKGKITSVRVPPGKASTTSVRDPFTAVNVRLDNAPFRKRYKPSISGTRRVGSTLTGKVTPWLAGSNPTTKASMSLQWKRNGSSIRGATSSRYKLTAADRGKRITVTATGRRYGFSTSSLTSAKTAPIR